MSESTDTPIALGKLEWRLDAELKKFNMITRPFVHYWERKTIRLKIVNPATWREIFTREYETDYMVKNADSVIEEVVFQATFS
jgi:hypothetical protein